VTVQPTTTNGEAAPVEEAASFSWFQRRLCPELEKAAQDRTKRLAAEKDASGQGGPAPNPEGVAALLSIAEDAIGDERERGRELDTKMASLVGFTGLILSLNVTLALPLLDRKLGWLGDFLMRVGFLVAVVALLIALLLGVVGVLAPQKYRGLGHTQIRDFTSAATQAMTAIDVQRAMLGALADILEQDRPVNNCKAKLTKRVVRWIAIGFFGMTAEALTLGLRKIGLRRATRNLSRPHPRSLRSLRSRNSRRSLRSSPGRSRRSTSRRATTRPSRDDERAKPIGTADPASSAAARSSAPATA
jgi:hypothetical protein